MSDKLIAYKCPSCGGVLSYDPKWSQYKCASCGSLFDVEGFRPKTSMGLHGFACTECGAELVGPDEAASFACPYCGNNEVAPSRFEGEFAPDYVIPFKLGLDEAKAKYKAYAESKEYLPDGFNERMRIVSVEGVYVPFWLFSGLVTFRLLYKFEYGSLTRAGTGEFARAPVDASVRMPNDMMDSLQPYDYGELRPFALDCMPGFVAERYTEDHDKSWTRVNKQVEQGIREVICPSDAYFLNGRSEASISDNGVEQALLPVWLFVVEFDGKKYLAGVNEQTGSVATNFPISVKKRLFFAIGRIGHGLGSSGAAFHHARHVGDSPQPVFHYHAFLGTDCALHHQLHGSLQR